VNSLNSGSIASFDGIEGSTLDGGTESIHGVVVFC
jgi:hypothetical protein